MCKIIVRYVLIGIFIIGCSGKNNSYHIEEIIIDGVLYYGIDSQEDLIWLSNPELLKLRPNTSLSQISDIQTKWSANYIQTKDITFDKPQIKNEKVGKKNKGKTFIPIGAKYLPFSGSFNGKEYNIYNLLIDRPEEDNVGLFSAIDSSKIENVNLINAAIVGKTNVGGVAGLDYDSVIDNCHVNGIIESKDFNLGGLIGEKEGGKMSNSSFKGTLEVENVCAGGLVGSLIEGIVINSQSEGKIVGYSTLGGIVGRNSGDYDYDTELSQNEIGPGSINNCSSSAIVLGSKMLGGIVGESSIGSIFGCHFNGNISGDYSIGGIVGSDTSSLISYCYNSGSINATSQYVGGIVGEGDDIYAEYDATINECYSTGNITGVKSVGGIVGSIRGNVINSYVTGTVTGEKLVGGIAGSLMFSGIVSNSYNIGQVTGLENVGGIAGEVHGMHRTTKTDREILNFLYNELKGSLKEVNLQIDKKYEGDLSYAILKNSYWSKVSTSVDRSIGKIHYFDNNINTINGAKDLKEEAFLNKNSFNRDWSINIKDTIWRMKKDLELGISTRPFLNWQKVVIQEVNDGKSIQSLIYNNKNNTPIVKVGYLQSPDYFFNKEVDTLCVENISISLNTLKIVKPCPVITNSRDTYNRIFVEDAQGNVWYGKTNKTN